MSAVLFILKLILYIILGFLGLVLAVMFIPAHADVRYEKKRFTVKLWALFITFTVFDSGEEKKSDEDEKQQGEVSGSAKDKLRQKGKVELRDALSLVLELIEPGFKAVSFIFKRLRFRDVQLSLTATGRDFAQTGIKAGRVWALIGSGLAVWNLVFPNTEFTKLDVIPVTSENPETDERDDMFYCRIYSLPIFMATAAVVFLIRFLKIRARRAAEIKNTFAEDSGT